MKKLIIIVAILTINFANAQKIYKEIQGEYENPILGDITIEGYELTYRGFTHIYQSETDNSIGDNYVYYKYPEEEGTIRVKVTYNGTKYLVFSDGNYILIPKDMAAQEDKESKRKTEAEHKAEIERKRVAEQQKIEKDRLEKEAKRRGADAILGGFSDGGYGSGGNYRLGNRNALNRPKPDYPCNEEGKVVVTITVNQAGEVISAVSGAKGTTNSASCLLTEAKEAAMKAKFNNDAKAPSKQVGEIIYNFSLSD